MTYTQMKRIEQIKMDRFNSWYNNKVKVTNYDNSSEIQVENSIDNRNKSQNVDDYVNFKKKPYKYNYYNNFTKNYNHNYSNDHGEFKCKEFNFQKRLSDNNNWRQNHITCTCLENSRCVCNYKLKSHNENEVFFPSGFSSHKHLNTTPLCYDTNDKKLEIDNIKNSDNTHDNSKFLKKSYKNCNVIESKNYPEIDHLIDTNDINKLDNCTLISKLKSLELEINIPIVSYGIVLYTYDKNKYLKYLICQRRDSISYIQYLQDLIDEKNIVKYINLMSKEEKKRCLEYYYKKDAHSIWKDLWITHKSKIYKNHYERCTNMFFKNMEKYLEHFKNENIGQIENSWCFPKGRLNKNENEIECAVRELEEETNISSDIINVNKNITFEELYIGSNNLIYKTVYYLAYIPYIPKKIYKYYPTNIRKKFISSEFQDLEWLDYTNVYNKLNEPKKRILEEINNYLKNKH